MRPYPSVRLAVLLGTVLLSSTALESGPYLRIASAQSPGPAGAVPGSDDATDARAAFSDSLAFRTDRIIADATHPLMAWLAQHRPVSYTTQGALRLRIAVRAATDRTVIRTLRETLVFGGSLTTHPFPVSLDLRGVPDGDYVYAVEIRDADVVLRTFEVPVKLVAGLDEQFAATERRLAKINGHDSAKASIRYPFDLARVINSGRRVFGSANNNPEFGLSQAGTPTLYDFVAGLKTSATLLTALERGRDPMHRARGETVRHYYMPEADEILPYRVFVPSTWDGTRVLPLVFVLHGNSRDQDFYFQRDGRIIPRTAEEHGYMLVAPLGYSPNGGYNYVPYGRAGGSRGLAAASATPQTFGPWLAAAEGTEPAGRGRSGRSGFGGVNGSVTPQLVRAEWSEQDAMHVFDLIREEYPIDPRRTFLFGYSAGGQGAHYLGPKFAEHWAAVAIGGSNARPGTGYPFDRLTRTPMLIFVGSDDTPNVAPARAMAEALRMNGVQAVLHEYPGATHDSAPSAATPDIFKFFDAHPRK